MEIEVFDIIHAVNRNSDKLTELISKVDNISTKIDTLSEIPALDQSNYLEDTYVCKILNISKRYLADLRNNNKINFFLSGRRCLYTKEDVQEYLDNNCRKNSPKT
jgi:excisionase family DNA binding protein